MRYFALLPNYLLWHYTIAIKDFRRVTDNLLWFIFNFFSIDILLRTLFSPWRRLSSDETSAHANFFTNFIVNILMRISGFVIRSITITIGVIFFVGACIVAIVAFLVWLGMPAVVIGLFLYGISFFI